MRNQFIAWFKKPFPMIESIRDILLISLGSGVVVLGILLLIKPFGIESYDGIFLFLFGFALISFVVTALNLYIFHKLYSLQKSTNWTTGKNFLFILWILFTISLSNFFYGEYLVNESYIEGLRDLNRTGFFSWISMTFSIGIIPVVFALYFIEKRLFEKNRIKAGKISEKIKGTNEVKSELLIELKSSKNTLLTISSADIICVKAEGGNYVSVFWQEKSALKKEIIRHTLAGILEVTNNTYNIVRCHKSFIINLDKVLSFQGNARSVTVRLDGLDFDIPVSRNFPREKLLTKI